MSWVSRRLALVEVLPESIQQQVREGKILAQVALKFLVPVARQSLEDCQRMAAIFVEQHCNTRDAGLLYGAWRKGSPAIRKRILAEPELFFKAQRQAQENVPLTPGGELLRDLEMITAIVNRAQRRLAGAAALEVDRQQGEAAQQQIARIQKQLQRINVTILPGKQPYVEPSPTHHDPWRVQVNLRVCGLSAASRPSFLTSRGESLAAKPIGSALGQTTSARKRFIEFVEKSQAVLEGTPTSIIKQNLTTSSRQP